MKNGLPVAYAIYRGIWTAFHIVLVAVLLISFIAWFVDDGQGARVVSDTWNGVVAVQQAVANAIPFPWGG